MNTTDTDLPEIQEWLESVDALVATLGSTSSRRRSSIVLSSVLGKQVSTLGSPLITDYINTISPEARGAVPG